jgi:radical SAM-linked protein
MRLRIIFSKTEAMRYTGHLDLHRTWERTVRRARLPLSYSQGFNPRPKINLAAALPLGYTSSFEIVEIWLEKELPLDEIEASLATAAPPGIEIQTVAVVETKGPKLPNLVTSAEYTVILLDPIPDLDERVEQLLESERLIRERRGKTYDLRPLVESAQIPDPTSSSEQQLCLRLAARTGATGRPDEVLDAMGIEPHRTRIERTSLHLRSV